MASAGAAQRPQADLEVVSRLEAEVKRLGERDLKCQAKLDGLSKDKYVVDKEHAEQQDAAQKEVTRLKDELTRLQGVEAEQHKMELHLKGQLCSLAMALKSKLICFS